MYLIIYFVSFLLQWLWLRLAYTHKRGIYRYLSFDGSKILTAILPVVNTFLCFIFWIFLYPIEKTEKQPRNYNWFIGKNNK